MLSFTDHTGAYDVGLEVEGGVARSVRFVPESELGLSVYGTGELARVELPAFPSDPAACDGPVNVWVGVTPRAGGALRRWRIYPASNASDPASRSLTTFWENEAGPIPMRGDRFYWLEVEPEGGPYVQEILQLRGLAP